MVWDAIEAMKIRVPGSGWFASGLMRKESSRVDIFLDRIQFLDICWSSKRCAGVSLVSWMLSSAFSDLFW